MHLIKISLILVAWVPQALLLGTSGFVVSEGNVERSRAARQDFGYIPGKLELSFAAQTRAEQTPREFVNTDTPPNVNRSPSIHRTFAGVIRPGSRVHCTPSLPDELRNAALFSH